MDSATAGPSSGVIVLTADGRLIVLRRVGRRVASVVSLARRHE
jgi:hypothetical protein